VLGVQSPRLGGRLSGRRITLLLLLLLLPELLLVEAELLVVFLLRG
jgi:hypothetical protein